MFYRKATSKYSKKIAIGIIGLGVGVFHLSNSLLNKDCSVKYICDINKKKFITLFYYFQSLLR